LGATANESCSNGDRDACGGSDLRERAIFYGRCAVFEDIAHGLETGKRMYAQNAIAALGWLFPA